MKLRLAQLLEEQLQSDGVDAEIRENYSGRGMMGELTPALVGDFDWRHVTQALLVVAHDLEIEQQYAERREEALADEEHESLDFDTLLSEVSDMRFDNMGRGSVLY